jgi:putative Mn2+ efflux pump MntP
MSCLSLAFWEDVLIRVVILIAVIAILRIIIGAMTGATGPWWPPVRAPWSPVTGPSPAGLIGIIAAVLEVIIWAAVLIFFIYLIFALLGCLIGASTFHIFPRY